MLNKCILETIHNVLYLSFFVVSKDSPPTSYSRSVKYFVAKAQLTIGRGQNINATPIQLSLDCFLTFHCLFFSNFFKCILPFYLNANSTENENMIQVRTLRVG